MLMAEKNSEAVKGLKKLPKVFYFATNPNLNSVLYIKLLLMFTHQFQLLLDTSEVVSNVQDILLQDSILIIAKTNIKEFIKIVQRTMSSRKAKKRLYVELEVFTEEITKFEGDIIYLSNRTFPYVKFARYDNAQSFFTAKQIIGENRMMVVYYEDKRELQKLINMYKDTYFYPFRINLQNAIEDDNRFISFTMYHNSRIPPYIFYVGPYERDASLFLNGQIEKSACYYLPSFDELNDYKVYTEGKHPCTIYYHKSLRSQYANLKVKKHELKKFIEFKLDLKEEWQIRGGTKIDQLFRVVIKREIPVDPYSKYTQEIFRKEWNHALLCLHPSIQKPLLQVCSLFWIKIVRGEAYHVDQSVSIHAYCQSDELKLHYGRHFVLLDSSSSKHSKPIISYERFESKSVEEISMQLQLSVAMYEHVFCFLRVYVVDDDELINFLEKQEILGVDAFRVDRLDDLPLMELKDHPFVVLVRDKQGYEAQSMLRFLNGVLIVFYQTMPSDIPSTKSRSLFVLNSEYSNRVYITKILKNFINPKIPKYDLSYKLNTFTSWDGLIKLPDPQSQDYVHLKIFLTYLENRSKHDQKLNERRLVFCTDSNVYQVIEELERDDTLCMLASCPHYWKRLYDRIPQLSIISSNVTRMLRTLQRHAIPKVELGLLRKQNRTRLHNCIAFIQLSDESLINQIRRVFEKGFTFKKGIWHKLKSQSIKGIPYVLIMESRHLDKLDEVGLEDMRNGFIFILEEEDIKLSMGTFSKLSRVSLVTRLRKELLGQLSYYSPPDLQETIKTYIKNHYK